MSKVIKSLHHSARLDTAMSSGAVLSPDPHDFSIAYNHINALHAMESGEGTFHATDKKGITHRLSIDVFSTNSK